MPDGDMLVVSMRDRRVLRRTATGNVVEHADLSGVATFHCNDMVVDGAGHAFVGNFGFDLHAFANEHGSDGLGDPSTLPSAVLARVDPDGTVAVAVPEMSFPNGSVISPDGRTLIVAETLARRLSAFDLDDQGNVTRRRVWADLARLGVLPDGICQDTDGAVWVANAVGPTANRIAEGGEVLDQVTFSQNCYACMLGGSSGTELFAMTAPSSDPRDASAARNGRIESAAVRVPTPVGPNEPRFR